MDLELLALLLLAFMGLTFIFNLVILAHHLLLNGITHHLKLLFNYLVN